MLSSLPDLGFVPISSEQHVVSCRWVFNIKYHPDGIVDRYKARLVVRGFI